MAGTVYMPSPTVPLSFHKAFNYVLLPLLGIAQIISFFTVTLDLEIVWAIILHLAVIALIVSTFIGLLKWQSWSYITLLALMIVGIVLYAILLVVCIWLMSALGSISSQGSYYLGSYYHTSGASGLMGTIIGAGWFLVILVIAVIVFNIFTIRYYLQRKNLFTAVPNQYQIMQGQNTFNYGAYGGPYDPSSPNQQHRPQDLGSTGSAIPGQNFTPQGTNPSGAAQTPPPVAGQQTAQPQQPQQVNQAQQATQAQQVSRKFCPNCGNVTENPNAKFCPKCGTGL